MKQFITRIELHGTSARYDELHAWMERSGFRRTITSSSGDVYHLPTATYVIETGHTCTSLRDWLIANLPPFGSNQLPWILVIEAASTAWRMGGAIRKAA